LPHVEFVYAVIALFALAQGPVYRLWSGSAESLVVSAKTSLPHVYFATFVAVQPPALIVARVGAADESNVTPIRRDAV